MKPFGKTWSVECNRVFLVRKAIDYIFTVQSGKAFIDGIIGQPRQLCMKITSRRVRGKILIQETSAITWAGGRALIREGRFGVRFIKDEKIDQRKKIFGPLIKWYGT